MSKKCCYMVTARFVVPSVLGKHYVAYFKNLNHAIRDFRTVSSLHDASTSAISLERVPYSDNLSFSDFEYEK